MFCTVDLLRVFFKAVLTLHYVIVNYSPKIALLLTVGLTFVLRVFLYVFFYISCTMIFNTHLLQENRVVNYNPS